MLAMRELLDWSTETLWRVPLFEFVWDDWKEDPEEEQDEDVISVLDDEVERADWTTELIWGWILLSIWAMRSDWEPEGLC